MVAAVHGVCEIAFLGIGQQGSEEETQLWLQLDLALLQGCQSFILLLCAQALELFAKAFLACCVEGGNGLSVQLSRSQRRLPAAIRRRSGIVRAVHVPDIGITVVVGHLTVNKDRHMGLDGTRSIAFRRDQARSRRQNESPLLSIEVFRLISVQLDRWLLGVCLQGNGGTGYSDAGARGQQKRSAAWWGEVGHFLFPTSCGHSSLRRQMRAGKCLGCRIGSHFLSES